MGHMSGGLNLASGGHVRRDRRRAAVASMEPSTSARRLRDSSLNEPSIFTIGRRSIPYAQTLTRSLRSRLSPPGDRKCDCISIAGRSGPSKRRIAGISPQAQFSLKIAQESYASISRRTIMCSQERSTADECWGEGAVCLKFVGRLKKRHASRCAKETILEP